MAQWHIERPDSPSKPIHQILSGIARGGFYVTNDNDEEASRAALLDALTDAGYPAPSPSDPVYAHRADTGNLERNTGTGWTIYPYDDTGDVPLTIVAGSPRFNPRVRRIGPEVACAGYVVASGIPATTWTRLATIPPDLRPAVEDTYPMTTNGPATGQLRVLSGGDIEVFLSSTTGAAIPLSGIRYRV